MTPAERARQAAAEAAAWIAASPNLIDVLGWHVRLCEKCQPSPHKCDEYFEILVEYGAGPYGTVVFWPDG